MMPRTRLDVVGLSESVFFDKPQAHIAKLHCRVLEQQQLTKAYTDKRRAARKSTLEPEDFVKIRI